MGNLGEIYSCGGKKKGPLSEPQFQQHVCLQAEVLLRRKTWDGLLSDLLRIIARMTRNNFSQSLGK